jgi:low affinity Fe/Cu permease
MSETFHRAAQRASAAVGRPASFFLAVGTIAVWGITGPLFHFSDTWQLIINTGTTIVTFLMVFLIQNTQNRDSKAMHLKLDELLRATRAARNTMVDLEDVSEDELAELEEQFKRVHDIACEEGDEGARRARDERADRVLKRKHHPPAGRGPG